MLIGLPAIAAQEWPWLDPAIDLLLAGWAIKEGIINTWHGDDCC